LLDRRETFQAKIEMRVALMSSTCTRFLVLIPFASRRFSRSIYARKIASERREMPRLQFFLTSYEASKFYDSKFPRSSLRSNEFAGSTGKALLRNAYYFGRSLARQPRVLKLYEPLRDGARNFTSSRISRSPEKIRAPRVAVTLFSASRIAR